MKTAWLMGFLLTMAVVPGLAAEPFTLAAGSWICKSPEVYDQAMKDVQQAQGQNLSAIKSQLLEQKRCMYVDAGQIEDMMAPFVTVLSRQDSKVNVSFTIEYYKRIAFLHRKITRVTYAGWTEATNLKDYQ